MIESIGPYQVQRELGRGGMGVVYLALDTRLDRMVAIKALPTELAADPARLERFEREAKTLATLSHPNLAGIYGVEEQEDARYLILEYVEGETLAERLDRGPLPVDDAIELAVQIAAGVEAAHAAGIVHRDLKPANIVITPSGQAKVLDFGLARFDEDRSSSGTLDARTLSVQHSPTIEGAILGTAAYMSPEQARGRRVDKQTDIWSFGVVLYEMLSGASPFIGETAGDSIGAVLHKQFDFTKLPSDIPMKVRRVLSRCLQRDKERRFRDIGDIRIELLGTSEDSMGDASTADRRSHFITYAMMSVLLCIIVVLGISMTQMKPVQAARPPVVADLILDLPAEHRLASWAFPRIAANGSRVVFVAQENGNRYLIVRDLEDRSCRVLPNTEGAFEPNMSPDGQWVSFQQDGMLKRVAVEGGPAITICDPESIRGTLWRNQSEILFGLRYGPMQRVSINSEEIMPLYEHPAGEIRSDRHPVLMPEGRGVVFTRVPNDGAGLQDSEIWGFRFDQEEPVQLVRGASHPFVLPSGHLLFMRSNSLMAVGFDAETMRVTTSEVPVLNDMLDPNAGGPRLFDISSSGTLVYFDTSSGMGSNESLAIQRINLEGVVEDLTPERAAYGSIAVSRDETMIAVHINPIESRQQQIQVLELERNLKRTVSGEIAEGRLSRPLWHPSGRFLYFSKQSGEGEGVYRASIDGLTKPEQLDTAKDMRAGQYPWDISPDARHLMVGDDSWRKIYEYPIDDQGRISGEPLLVLEQDSPCYGIKYSPDGRWLAFLVSLRTGTELFVTSREHPGRVIVQVSVGGATMPQWDLSGQRLMYSNLRNGVEMAYFVDYTITPDGDFKVGKPEEAFDLRGVDGFGGHLANDGQSLFVVRQPEQTEATSIVPRIFVNWTTSIEDKLPKPSNE